MRLFIALGSFVLLLLLGALIAPYFINWTAFRDDFEREATRLLGEPVTVRGDASARLLPFPSLTFTDVVVGEDPARPTMTLASFSMDAELAPYLSGEIRIFEMRLGEPHLRIRSGTDAFPSAAASPGDSSGSTVILENVEISDGRISFENETTGQRRELSNLEASLSARSLSGPFNGSGRLTAEHEALDFSLSSGTIQADGTWPFRLTLTSARLDASFSFDGVTGLADDAADFSGTFELVTPAAGSDEPALLPPVRVTSEIELTPSRATLASLRAEVGSSESPYVLTGEGSLDLLDEPRFALVLQGEQVDVDQIATEDPDAEATLLTRAEAVRRTLAAIPVVPLAGEVQMSLPVVIAGDTTIRNMQFIGSPAGDGWAIRDFSAELPGRTLVEATGDLRFRDELTFDGNLLLASRQPSRFASWLGGTSASELNDVGRAGFLADVELSGRRQVLENLEIDVDGQSLNGRLERVREDAVLSVSADLGGEAADLDKFTAFARLFVGDSAFLEPVDRLDVRFDAGPVAFRGYESAIFGVDFAYSGGLLDLRSLVVTDFAGTDLEARGTVAELLTDPRPDLAVDLQAQSPQQLLDLAAERLPDSPLVQSLRRQSSRLGPLRLSVLTSSPIEDGAPALDIRLEGEAGQTDLSLALALENGLAAVVRDGRFGLELRLASADPVQMLGQFGFEGFDLGVSAPLTLAISASGREGRPVSASAQLRAPGSTVSANGSLELSTSGIEEAELALKADSEDASLWLSAAGIGLGQGLEGLPVALAGRLAWFGGDWSLSEVDGSIGPSQVDLALQGTLDGPVTGSAHLSELSLPWLARLVYASEPVVPVAGAGWPEEPFGSSLLPFDEVTVALRADSLDLDGEAIVTGFSSQVEARTGGLQLGAIAGTVRDGALSGTLDLRNAGGFGSLEGEFALQGAGLGSEGGDALLQGRLSGDLDVQGSGRSYAELVGSMTGQGEALLEAASLKGIPVGGLPDLLAAADAPGFSNSSETVADLVRSLDANARYPVGSPQLPLTVGTGDLRFAPVTVERPDETLTLSGEFSLAQLDAEATFTLRFAPGEEERIEETSPAVTYQLAEDGAALRLADVEGLAGYLSVRAYRREEARLEALREDLRETLRLRREVRFYRARAAERERIAEEAAAEARAEREAQEAEQAARVAAEQAAREAEEARQAEEARRQAEAERSPPPAPAPSVDLDLSPPAPAQVPPAPPQQYEGLPGVSSPLEF